MKNIENRKKVGDIVRGWEITDIYFKDIGSQQVAYAKVKSTLGDNKEHEYRLTLLNNEKIGWPDRRRPDVSEKNTKHGLAKHPLWSVWNGMRARCLYHSHISYKNYGERGISVCDDWNNSFKSFYNWAINNGWKQGLTLDRKNNDNNYEPDNCRWSTPKEQNDNRSISISLTAFGETKNISDWALDARCQCSYWSLLYRVKKNWDHEQAITTPSRKKSNFKRYKQFYQWCQENHPETIDEYINQ